jgi:hypothetical protein
MARWVDPFAHNTMLDGNILNQVASRASATVNRLLDLQDLGVNIVLPYTVREEVDHPATPQDVREAATTFVYTEPVDFPAAVQARRDRLVAEARGNAQSKNVERDLHHIFETGLCGGGHFVTRDEWLLRNSERIWMMAHVEVVTPEQFVDRAETALARRRTRRVPR